MENDDSKIVKHVAKIEKEIQEKQNEIKVLRRKLPRKPRNRLTIDERIERVKQLVVKTKQKVEEYKTQVKSLKKLKVSLENMLNE